MTTTAFDYKLQWGCNAALPLDAEYGWGARAIYKPVQGKDWDIPHGRTDTFGDREKVLAMFEHLKKDNALDKAAASWLRRDIRSDDERIHTLYSGGGYTIKGSCQGSCGHVYLVAFPTPTP